MTHNKSIAPPELSDAADAAPFTAALCAQALTKRTMFRKALALLAAIALSSSGIAQPLEDLQLELLEMAAIDQEFRARMMPFLAGVDFTKPPTEEFQKYFAEQQEIDTRHSLRLIEIVDLFGWPRRSEVGLEASKAAQLLVQHFDLESQKRLLPSLKEAVLAGEADASSMAMLEDDILVAEGKDQIYGTEIVNAPDGGFKLYPVQEPSSLNERRLEVGLPTIEEYISRGEAELGAEIDVSVLTDN